MSVFYHKQTMQADEARAEIVDMLATCPAMLAAKQGMDAMKTRYNALVNDPTFVGVAPTQEHLRDVLITLARHDRTVADCEAYGEIMAHVKRSACLHEFTEMMQTILQDVCTTARIGAGSDPARLAACTSIDEWFHAWKLSTEQGTTFQVVDLVRSSMLRQLPQQLVSTEYMDDILLPAMQQAVGLHAEDFWRGENTTAGCT